MKIAVALSGGVDSSVAAYLLKDQGHEVVGITLRLWHFNDDKHRPGGCCSLEDISDAKRVCDYIGIPHYVLNLEKEFKETVVENFIQEYLRGRTPNPCIVCNEVIKFGMLLERVKAMGFEHLSTGHYVRVERDAEGRCRLKKAGDDAKDQSYVLYRLTQKELSRLVFPLGGYTKKEIRAIAEKQCLPVAHKPESQEICFIDTDYAGFLRSYVPGFEKKILPGPIVDTKGTRIGMHKGYPFYTIGQRSGLGLTSPVPLYVVAIDPHKNKVTVGTKEEVFARSARIVNLSWVAGTPEGSALPGELKIRRLHTPASGMLHLRSGAVEFVFDNPQPAVTPGQAAVFYQGEYVLGGGIIA